MEKIEKSKAVAVNKRMGMDWYKSNWLDRSMPKVKEKEYDSSWLKPLRDETERARAIIKELQEETERLSAETVKLRSKKMELLAKKAEEPKEPSTEDILKLAAIIREIDGDNSKGAAALAEEILCHRSVKTIHFKQ